MKINLEALNSYLSELNDLSNKPNHNPQEKRRYAFLLTACAAIRSGASVEDVDDLFRNDAAKRAGITLPAKRNAVLTREEEVEAREWKQIVERRDMVEGDPAARLGTATNLGFLVPTDFFPQMFRSMKKYDALFDESVVTFIKSANARPLPIPIAEDTNVVASVVSENGSQTSVDIDSTNHAVLGGYSYSTPRFVASLEAFDDLDSALTVSNLYKEFSADRVARGVGHDLVIGDGVNKPLGLVQALIANNVSVVFAAGANANTGNAGDTLYNSLGSADFASCVAALDEAYAESPKCCWLMSKKTLAAVEGYVTKQGLPLGLVHYEQEEDGSHCPYILGYKVCICPSMPGIGANQYPVVFGDASYWATRLIVGQDSGIRTYFEGAGLAENGNFGMRTFVRADGQLLWAGQGNSPFVLLKNHSS